jgi:hypothetical protein
MNRYPLYLTVALLAFGFGVYFAFSFYYSPTQTMPQAEDSIGGGRGETIETGTSGEPVTVKMSEKGEDDKNSFLSSNKESLSYKGFTVFRQYKKHVYESRIEDDVPFAVIKKGGRKIFEFDGRLNRPMREIRFGLVPLLGDENNKQLIIDSTADRYWRYAVINLAPEFEVLFDSGNYPLMREIIITDLDGDGRKEMIQDLRTFFYFGITARKGFARTPIVFTYDTTKRKYVFANPQFADYLLKPFRNEASIEDKIRSIEQLKLLKSSDPAKYNRDLFDAVMSVFLTYLYTGKEKEAWRHFEEYDLPDKEEVRAEIRKYLAKDTLYKKLLTKSEK